MRTKIAHNGFLLVEILVSLFVVSLTAVNITGLQKLIVEQNRDNVAHTEVISLANQKMNELLSYENITQIDGLNTHFTTATPGLTEFNLAWTVSPVPAESADMRTVTLKINWENSKGDELTYTYSEQVNLALLLSPYNGDPASIAAVIVESVLKSKEVIYFDPNIDYKTGAFAIYNSELFQALGNVSSTPGTTSGAWRSYGLIDNPELANNPDLAILFPASP